MPAPQIILDTDFSVDCDDAVDLFAILMMHRLGWVNLLAINVNSSNQFAPGAIKGLCALAGLGSIPVGALKTLSVDPGGPGVWVPNMYAALGGSTYGLASAFPDAVSVATSVLSSAAAASITLVNLGFGTVWSQMLTANSSLVAAKVKEAVWAAGDYPTTAAEFNIQADTATARAVMLNWPTTMVFTGYADGNSVVTGANLQAEFPTSDPIRKAYQDYGVDGIGRPAWGQLAILWATFGRQIFGTLRGDNRVNIQGNDFTTNPNGRDYYATKLWSDSQYVRLLNNFVSFPRSSGLPAAWKYGQATLVVAA